MAELLNPTNDYVFKRLFSDSPDVLASLINDLRPQAPPIGGLVIVNPEILPHDIEGQQLDLATLKEREVYLEQRLTDLRRRLSQLEVRAPYAGVWISDISVDRLGSSMSRNQRLGLLLSEGNIRFVAAVAQEKAANLFAQPIASAEIRLRGRFAEPLQASQTFFIPYQKHELPSAAMGIPAGGPIMANWDERGRMLADEPFFELQAVLDIADQTELLDGVLGSVRIMQPPMPLLQQAVLRLRQLLQARYQL